MHKILNLNIWLLMFFICSFGQTKDDKNIPVGVFNWQTGDFPLTEDNMKDKLKDFKPDEDFLAVAVCSSDPLPVALELAAGSPIFITEKLRREGVYKYDSEIGATTDLWSYVSENQIIFLRQNKKCPLVKDKYLYTEYTIVRPNNEFPEFVEARNASEIADFNIIYDDNYYETGEFEKGKELTPDVYKTALATLVKFMKERRTAIAVITIPFYGRYPSKIISRRVLEAQKSLKESGIGNHRVFVRKISRGIDSSMNESNNKYPNITVVYEK